MQIQDLKSSLFIGLNWIFLSFVQTAVIISIKGKKNQTIPAAVVTLRYHVRSAFTKNNNKEILLGRVLQTAVGVT